MRFARAALAPAGRAGSSSGRIACAFCLHCPDHPVPLLPFAQVVTFPGSPVRAGAACLCQADAALPDVPASQHPSYD